MRPALLPDLSALTLLVVAHDALMIDAVSLFFKACGTAVLEAQKFRSAWLLMDSSSRAVDAVFIDTRDMRPYARKLADKLRRRQPSPFQLRTIALVSDPSHHAESADFDAVLYHPLNFDDVSKLACAIAESRQTRDFNDVTTVAALEGRAPTTTDAT